MAQLPTNRTTSNSAAEHVSDHNELHDGHNQNEGHRSDTTNVHGVVDTGDLILEGDSRLTDSRSPSGAAGGVLAGTYPNPSFSADLATQAELDSHASDTTSIHGIADTANLVLTDDSRLTDSRTPSGSAGGVLSGTYPNPGFLVDMATQAELDSVSAAKANTSHSHVIGDLPGTLATDTEVATEVATAVATHEGLSDPHTGYQKESEKGQNDGYASLDSSGDVPITQLPSSVVAEYLGIALGDETTDITDTGNPKVTFRMPFAMTLTAVRASLTTASSSGTPTFDINESGSSVLSTKLTIDANERTSTTATSAAVISDSSLADDAEITVDVDIAGTGAKGAKIWLIGTRS